MTITQSVASLHTRKNRLPYEAHSQYKLKNRLASCGLQSYFQ